MASENLNG